MAQICWLKVCRAHSEVLGLSLQLACSIAQLLGFGRDSGSSSSRLGGCSTGSQLQALRGRR